ncbi:MAG: MoaD/ThiS family protein [Parasphingopyxis sp.]|nr:MoaD/ThiS family protein [Sphingomonadales bacterium]
MEHDLKVLFFGILGYQFGREAEIEVSEACSVAELRKRLAAMRPDCEDAIWARSVRACVDQRMVSEDTMVGPGQEVAFFPPLSGG